MKNNLDNSANIYKGENPYEFENNLMQQAYVKRIIHLSKNLNHILDLGIGNGTAVLELDKYVKRHVVIEGSEKLIDDFKSSNNVNDMKLVHSYFEEFKTEEKFDVIVFGFILEHVDDPKSLLEQYSKFLKPNGEMYIMVPNWEALNKKIAYYAGMIANMHVMTDTDKALGHQTIFNIDIIKDIVLSSGLIIEKLEGLFLKPIASSQMQKLEFNEQIYEALIECGISYPELSAGILVKCTSTF